MSLPTTSPLNRMMLNGTASLPVHVTEASDDSQAFKLNPVISDLELSGVLFASCGNILLVCGRGKQDKTSYYLCTYEIPSATLWLTAWPRLLKMTKLPLKTVTQLQTIRTMKFALLLGDGAVCVYDLESLEEICAISNNAVMFAIDYDTSQSQPAPPNQMPLGSQPSLPTSSDVSAITPIIVRLCVASQNHHLTFFRCRSQQGYFEEEQRLPEAFELFDIPLAMALSGDRVCVAYEKSYAILSLTTGMIIHEIFLTKKHTPLVNCLQDQTQWCIQRDVTTLFLNSDFEPLFKNELVWRDIPSAIVQVTPYVLALTNDSVDICIFNGAQSVAVQRVPLQKSPKVGKYHLWKDTQTNQIYLATSLTLHSLQPTPVNTQIEKFIANQRYDFALSIIRASLNISLSNNNPPRINDGHSKGNLDMSIMARVQTFTYNKQGPTGVSSNISLPIQNSSRTRAYSNPLLNKLELWHQYYRVGTMYAFQLFHQEQFQQAFVEFHECLTDPAEIICLFAPLSVNVWLNYSHSSLTNFIQQHQQFSEPQAFTGAKLQKALEALQPFLTELRRVFQSIYRRTPDMWLEVQSLVQNDLILRPIRDLLTIIETALFKLYLLDKQYILINALLRNEDSCCLPWEVEAALTRENRYAELVSFYEQQARHREALHLITNTKSLSFVHRVLDYLSKLDNNHLPLIFQYIQPIVKSALQQRNEELLTDLLTLFIGELVSSSPEQLTIRFDPMAVSNFLKDLNLDFAIRHLQNVLLILQAKSSAAQRVSDHAATSLYYSQHQELSGQLNRLTQAKQSNYQNGHPSSPQGPQRIAQIHEGSHHQHHGLQGAASSVTNQHHISPVHTAPVQSQVSCGSSNPTPSVTVCQGDLAEQQIDVIAVCSSSHYLFDAICRAGGNAMRVSYITEAKKMLDAPVIAVKSEGDIVSKRVYFLPWKVHFDKALLAKSMRAFVENAVTKAVQEGYQSIAFPAIGCGQVGCSIQLIAQAMVEEAHQLVHKYAISILFVIEPQRTDVYEGFQRQINLTQQSPVLTQPAKVVSLPVNKGVIEVEFGDLATQKVDAIIVSSSSQYLKDAILKAAGKQAETSYNTEYKNNSDAILISIPAGVLPSKRIFFVKWEPNKDEVKLHQSLVDLVGFVIKNAVAYQCTSLAFPAIGCGKYGCSIDIVVKTLVKEMRYQLSTKDLQLTVKFVIQPDQQNIYEEFCRQVLTKREEVPRSMNYEVPATWEKSQDSRIRFVLSDTSYEYKLIATNFDQGMKGKYNQIVRIERIQNERWYVQYMAHSHSFQGRLNKNTERSLYHGCPESTVNLILEECFNRSFAGANGTAYGVGVYFSSDPAYSHLYTKSNIRGERSMFLARVLIGNTTLGNVSMKTRPVGYDSTTDGKHIFVTYHDAQAYAEYLITYK